MELQELYQKIGLQKEIVEQLIQIEKEFDLVQVEKFLDGMLQEETAEKSYTDLSHYLQEDKGNMKMLYCQLECARRTYERYQKLQIPENIYIDTMKCFTRFAEECNKKNGAYFFDRGWWTYRQISMRLFRIGVLEYELLKKEGIKRISIHIPSDAELKKAQVDVSFREAKSFLHQFYPAYETVVFFCESWLLSPILEKLLSKESNILSFQQRFEITKVYPEPKDFLEWLFQCSDAVTYGEQAIVYEQLPENTSLQRKAKQWLLQGGTIGVAYGELKES